MEKKNPSEGYRISNQFLQSYRGVQFSGVGLSAITIGTNSLELASVWKSHKICCIFQNLSEAQVSCIPTSPFPESNQPLYNRDQHLFK